jgi:hypothetical protein
LDQHIMLSGRGVLASVDVLRFARRVSAGARKS